MFVLPVMFCLILAFFPIASFMVRFRRIRVPMWTLNALAWMVLAVYAYRVAGSYQFFNCWLVIPLYIPPIGLIAVALLLVSAYWFIRHLKNQNTRFYWSSHVLLVAVGFAAATIAAQIGTDGFASCL